MSGRLVAFTGYAGSGKSTAADVLVRDGWVRVKFADPIKDMTRALLSHMGVEPNQIEQYIEGDKKELPVPTLDDITPRYIMQTIGTEWGRNYVSDSIWLDIARRRIDALWLGGHSVVIDDCRFANEADLINEYNGTICQISCRGGRATQHASENLPEPTFTLYNDKAKSQFEGMIRHIFGDDYYDT